MVVSIEYILGTTIIAFAYTAIKETLKSTE